MNAESTSFPNLRSLGRLSVFRRGHLIAFLFPVWASIAAVLAIETFLLLSIHDSLILNIIMLIHPVEGIRAWQSSL